MKNILSGKEMKVIRFRRLNRSRWEIAFNEKGLNDKLNGEMAEIVMPAKPFLTRLRLMISPMKPEEKSEKREQTDG